MNKKCVALTQQEYRNNISLLRSGFILEGERIKPNERIATVVVLQACLGLRLGDVLQLRLDSFIRDGDRWRLDIYEQKTGKARNFTVPLEIYSFIQEYVYKWGINRSCKLFDISARQVERHLNKVFTKMELPLRSYGSHSFRKFFATKIYLENDYNVELVRVFTPAFICSDYTTLYWIAAKRYRVGFAEAYLFSIRWVLYFIHIKIRIIVVW